MSFDYSVVAKGRKRTRKQMRALVSKIAPLLEDADVEDELDGDEDFDFLFEDVGSIQISRLRTGYLLSVDSNSDGNRDHWEDICEVANKIAAALGEIVDAETASKMRGVSEPAREAVSAKPGSAAPNASRAIVELFDVDGRSLESVSLFISHFAEMLDAKNMPSKHQHSLRPRHFDEEHRYATRAVRMVATSHDPSGRRMRRYTWPLDGYGRIKSVSVDDL
jgi:hypothetical protein